MSGTNISKFGLIFLMVSIIIYLISICLIALINNIFVVAIVGIVNFIGMIFFLVGFILLVVGGYGYSEYGDSHKKFTMIALILFIAILIFGLIFIIVTVMATFSAMLSGYNFDGLKNALYFTPIFAVLVGMIYLFLLYHIEDKIGKVILLFSFVLGIIVSVIIFYLGIPIIDKLIGSIDISSVTSTAYQQVSTEVSLESTRLAIFNLPHNILLLVAIILPYMAIVSGKLQKIESKPIPQTYQTSAIVMKSCPKCGSKNNSESKFCEECGEIL